MIKKGYLLGVGSNIEPHKNMALIVKMLLEHFPVLTLSRVLELPPIGMKSNHDFLNVVIFIETAWTEKKLKSICNQIEIQLGRDKSDPDSKHKDRPADLDILSHIELPKESEDPIHLITDEYFIYPLLNEIIAYLMDKSCDVTQAGVSITRDDLAFGQTATTIHRDANSRDKRILK